MSVSNMHIENSQLSSFKMRRYWLLADLVLGCPRETEMETDDVFRYTNSLNIGMVGMSFVPKCSLLWVWQCWNSC